MAFLLSLSSNIAKRLLLFALSRLDLLDKDPSDFVDVAVGTRSTLELRDVGLKVKRLTSLLHLELPPELNLTKARVALLRIILSLDPSNAGITIEVDGVHIQAELVSAPPVKGKSSKPTSPRLPSERFPRNVSLEDEDDDEHIPTTEELALSFLEEEPVQERRELEAAFQSQSHYLQESQMSEDDEDVGVGMGVAPTLPGFLENFITAALDKSQVAIQNINIRLDVSLPPQEKEFAPGNLESTPISLHFHVQRAAVDGLSSQNPQVEVPGGALPSPLPNFRNGKRRMALRNICAQLVSSPELFAASARSSRPSSPLASRSNTSSSVKDMTSSSSGTPSVGDVGSPYGSRSVALSESIGGYSESEAHEPIASSIHSVVSEAVSEVLSEVPLEASIMTADEDRFADARPEDDEDEDDEAEGEGEESDVITASRIGILQSQHLPAEGKGDSTEVQEPLDVSIGGLWPSQHEDAPTQQSGPPQAELAGADQGSSSSARLAHSTASSARPSDDVLPQHSGSPESQERPASRGSSATEQGKSHHSLLEVASDERMARSRQSSDGSSVGEDLAESRLYEPEEARSLYLSAYSEAGPNVPGAWDSESSSSGSLSRTQDAGQLSRTPVPDPKCDTEDGCETPRPGSRAASHPSAPASPEIAHGHASPQQHRELPPASMEDESPAVPSLLEFSPDCVAKTLLSIDETAIWFPWPLFGRDDDEGDAPKSPTAANPEQSLFSSSIFGADTFHNDMPGSFSMYAERTATHRRKTSDVRTEAARQKIKASVHQAAAPGEKPQGKKSIGVEVEIGNIRIHIDVPSSLLLFRLVQRLKEAFASPTTEKQSKAPAAEPPAPTPFAHKVSVESFGLMFVESVTVLPISEDDNLKKHMLPKEAPQNTILQLSANGLRLDANGVGENLQLDLAIEKFSLGLLGQDILSFDPRSKPRMSVSELRQTLPTDVRIQFRSSPTRTELDLATRLVRINFDVQKLDEAFSSFGGFSGMLELSNSIASASTIHVSQPPVPIKPRGVHFERAPDPPAAASGLPIKLNAHIYGVNFDFRSKSCAVNLRTTTIRIIGRPQAIALVIGEIRVSGPYVGNADGPAPFSVELSNTRMEFIFSPHEKHLASLLSLITPSNYRYEDEDDIIIEALLRQRRKGAVLEANVKMVRVEVLDLSQAALFSNMADDLAKLSTVAKYLPEDDRPGVLTLANVEQINVHAFISEKIGFVDLACRNTQVAHVGLPVLLAVGIGSLSARRNESELLIHDVLPVAPVDDIPMVMARMVGDEMEPTIKVKLYNCCLEYQVSTIMAVLGLGDDTTSEDIIMGMAESVATITGPQVTGTQTPEIIRRQSSSSSVASATTSKPLRLDLLLRDSALGLSPRDAPSKGLIVLTDTRFLGSLPKGDGFSAKLEVRKASILLIDDIGRFSEQPDVATPSRRNFSPLGSRQVTDLCQRGFVSVSTISSAVASVSAKTLAGDGTNIVDVEFKDDLFLLETCADSTQTMIALLNGLAPPMPPSKDIKYQTKIMPVEDMMASFSGDAYMTIPEDETAESTLMVGLGANDDEIPPDVDMVGSFYNPDALPTDDDIDDNLLEGDLEQIVHPPPAHKMSESTLLESFQEQRDVASSGELEFHDEYFGAEPETEGTAHKWDSEKKQYDWRNQFSVTGSPLRIRVRDMQIIWHLFDGYDWVKTRDTIAEAVQNVEQRAEERRQRRAMQEEDEEIMIEEDFLFNSVWITLPVNEEKGALTKKINHEIDDLVSETGSYATSMASRATARTHGGRSKKRGLRLERSRHHKISFELRGTSADIIVFPPGTGETQSSIDLRVHDFEIFDHVPSSTWKKFATYMYEAGEREMGRPQMHIELLNVKPVPTLAASEIVIRVTVLPLRLHVDQDALDFITRFFEFKDESVAPPKTKAEEPFLQRIEVNTVKLKLDYKPKKVDYAGLRSGHTTEFMNFFILDAADITLRHVILYGVSGFDKLHKTLNDIWMPDVKRNQLPTVLAGLAPVRSLVNVGGGVRDLVVIPMREYKKDGRVVRSIQKGAVAFAKTTSSELARLGAKIAIGTQNVLEGAENILVPPDQSPGGTGSRHDAEWEDVSPSGSPQPSIERRAVSNYADQPIGVMAGLRSAARSLERDLLTTRDAIIAIPAEVMESGSAGEAAKAIAKRAPTVILRPAIGATRALGTALLGAGNAVDREASRRKLEDKYKRR